MPRASDWLFCDGDGRPRPALPPSASRPNRRQVLGAGFAAALAVWAERSALAQVSLVPDANAQTEGDILVTLFLRGGMDGLSAVVPYADDNYYRARPTIGLAKPGDKRKNASGGVLDLNGFFGFHPALSALLPLYKDGLLGVVQAVGSQDQTRSHFEAMAAMERGVGDNTARLQNGWLARYLSAVPVENPSPLRAAAWADTMPDILRGASGVSVLQSLADFRLTFGPEASLAALYENGAKTDAVTEAGRETLHVLETLKRIDPAHYKAANGAAYPETPLGDGFKQVALLIKANVGLEAACLDRGGWDTHVAQGGIQGFLGEQLKDVGNSLAAFVHDLGKEKMNRVTVVVMTEFGRRAYENSGLGTDHGRASTMLVAGGNVLGGKVYGTWPGLGAADLEGPGDLRVTTDYRTVLGEIIRKRMGRGNRHGADSRVLSAVFPGAPDSQFLGMITPRLRS